MALLHYCSGCSSAEDLHDPQGEPYHALKQLECVVCCATGISGCYQSQFDAEELERVSQTKASMTELLSEEELLSAVGEMKNVKAEGELVILLEMVKAVS